MLTDFSCFLEAILAELFSAIETFLSGFGINIDLPVPDFGCGDEVA